MTSCCVYYERKMIDKGERKIVGVSLDTLRTKTNKK